jgi:hypothetical protein
MENEIAQLVASGVLETLKDEIPWEVMLLTNYESVKRILFPMANIKLTLQTP